MKILVLNPHIDAEHKTLKALEKRGLAVLTASNLEEAMQMLQLHGASIDLAVVHREGIEAAGSPETEPGLRFIGKVKGMREQTDLPVILTSSHWTDADCARHQQSPLGANAYLRWPFQEKDLFQLIQAVMGDVPAALANEGATQVATQVGMISPPESSPSRWESSGMILEDASQVSGIIQRPTSEFQLEGPELSTDEGTLAVQQPEPGEIASSPEESGIIVIQPEAAQPVAEPTREPAINEHEPGLVVAGDGESPVISPATEREDFVDDQAAQEMPYLFNAAKADPLYALGQPVGDAVVPGGAAHSPDTETLKKYLLLREQDVAVLSTQLKTAHEQIAALEDHLRAERVRANELEHAVHSQSQRIEHFEKEKAVALESFESEMNDLRFQAKVKADKVRLMEMQVREATEETARLKERVRNDIRKIRVREKELENRLEIMKKDSEALITARENKIVELKRKVDLLEFNMDLLQDQYMREKETSAGLRERLSKAAQVLRVAGGVLEPAGPQAQDPAQGRDGKGTAEGGRLKREAS